jgi:hypothetical protein
MKKNSNAFVIIKSLTMSEKRYFKLFSERHTIGEQNKYVALFDQLDKIEAENDTVLKSNLKALGVNPDFISADKNYLYQLILRSLNEFHNSKTYNLKIKESLVSIEILFHKGLYHECLKLITRAEEFAIECENFQLMIDVLMWKKKCCGYSIGLKEAAAVNTEIDIYLELLSNLKRFTDLYYESNLLQATNEKQNKALTQQKYQQILNEPELQSEEAALSFSAKIFHHLIYSNYYFSIDNKPLEFEHLQKLVDILNISKTYSTENPLDYISIYNRLLAIKKHFKTSTFFNDIEVLNEFAKKPHIKKEVVLERVFIHTNTHELEYYLINNDFDTALKKLADIEKNISKLDIEIEHFHLIYFYYLQAITLVYLGQFHKALKFVNKILNDFKFDSRPQVYARIEVLNIIIHYELKNYSLVTSFSKQVLKSNAKHKILIFIEEALIGGLAKLSNASIITLKDEVKLLQDIENLILETKVNSTSTNNTLIDNYYKWIKAKLNKRSVSEN